MTTIARSQSQARHLSAFRRAISKVEDDALLDVDSRVDSLKHARGEIDAAIRHLRNPRPVSTSDAEFMELIN